MVLKSIDSYDSMGLLTFRDASIQGMLENSGILLFKDKRSFS